MGLADWFESKGFESKDMNTWTPDFPEDDDDPQAIRDPRPDTNTWYVDSGSRVIQWGWAPVGGSKFFDDGLTPNWLASVGEVGTVTVITT